MEENEHEVEDEEPIDKVTELKADPENDENAIEFKWSDV